MIKDLHIIGAGIAARALVDEVRSKDKNCKITVIDKENIYFDKREFLCSLSTNNKVDIPQWTQDNSVDFIQANVERINPNRKKIYFKDRDVLDFDTLVIATGLVSKKKELKGEHREGFFYLSSIEPFKLKDLIRISRDATVYVSTILGIILALTLRARGLDVKIVCSDLDFLGEDKEAVVSALSDKGIMLYLDSQIEEAIGEGVVKAVKIIPFKVFSSHLVFIDSGFVANCSFFEEPLERRDVFFTNHPDIYTVGDVTNTDVENEFFFYSNYQDAQVQGQLLADYFLEAKPLVYERTALGIEQKRRIIEDILRDEKSETIKNV